MLRDILDQFDIIIESELVSLTHVSKVWLPCCAPSAPNRPGIIVKLETAKADGPHNISAARIDLRELIIIIIRLQALFRFGETALGRKEGSYRWRLFHREEATQRSSATLSIRPSGTRKLSISDSSAFVPVNIYERGQRTCTFGQRFC